MDTFFIPHDHRTTVRWQRPPGHAVPTLLALHRAARCTKGYPRRVRALGDYRRPCRERDQWSKRDHARLQKCRRESLRKLKYPAPGAPDLARRTKELIEQDGFGPVVEDAKRGLDHGTWVPLMLMYPEADIPVYQLSIRPDKDAMYHYNLGRALLFQMKGFLYLDRDMSYKISAWLTLMLSTLLIGPSALIHGSSSPSRMEDAMM